MPTNLIPVVEGDTCVWNRANTVRARLGFVRDILLHERRDIRDLVQSAMQSHAHTSMLADCVATAGGAEDYVVRRSSCSADRPGQSWLLIVRDLGTLIHRGRI